MILCFICDIHLPYTKSSIQHVAFDWIFDFIKKGREDVVIFAGDFTANGDVNAANYFKNRIKELEVPTIVMTGNSDLRTPENIDYIQSMRTPSYNVIDGQVIYTVDDSTGQISSQTLDELYSLDKNAIVVLHHPIEDLYEPSKSLMVKWRESHLENVLFCAHEHISKVIGNTIYLQALDPDKAIGNGPSITHYDTETKIVSNGLFISLAPKDIFDYIGISCFYPMEDIQYARENNIKHIELRDTVIEYNLDDISFEIEKWRKSGGKSLSMHAPEVTYEDAIKGISDKWEKFTHMAAMLNADRITLHVPKASVRCIRENPENMNCIIKFLKKYFSKLNPACVIGVENMHMTSADNPDDTRRFGYIPEEVIEFMELLSKSVDQKVGVNFDTGHARNNAPFSQKYNIGAWFEEIGKHTVGYHIHQVTYEGGKFSNHMPIDHPYGKLISLASLFDCWDRGMINKVPIICEIRGDGSQGAYKSTIEMFNRIKKFRCGDDD